MFAGTYFHFLILQIWEFTGRHYEACKIGKIFRKYLTAIVVNILITLIVCTYFFQAETEEEGLSYYQMRRPGTIYLIKDLIKFRIKNNKIVKFRTTQRMILTK